MSANRAINCIVDRMVSTKPFDSHAVARIVSDALKTDVISRRNAEIQSIIADCDRLRRAEAAGKPAAANDTQRRQIENQIAELQRQLEQLSAA